MSVYSTHVYKIGHKRPKAVGVGTVPYVWHTSCDANACGSSADSLSLSYTHERRHVQSKKNKCLL